MLEHSWRDRLRSRDVDVCEDLRRVRHRYPRLKISSLVELKIKAKKFNIP